MGLVGGRPTQILGGWAQKRWTWDWDFCRPPVVYFFVFNHVTPEWFFTSGRTGLSCNCSNWSFPCHVKLQLFLERHLDYNLIYNSMSSLSMRYRIAGAALSWLFLIILFILDFPVYTCLSSIDSQSTNQTFYNWNCLSTRNCLAPFVLARCRVWVSRGF